MLGRLSPLLLLAACGQAEPPTPTYGPVLATRLEATAPASLPDLPASEAREMADLLEMLDIPGRIGRQAERTLGSLPEPVVASAALLLLEDLQAPVEARRNGSLWLATHGGPAVLPRLTLRLKYETDPQAVLAVAEGLLRRGSGAGLDAVSDILGETDRYSIEIRSRASNLLALLPGGTAKGTDAAGQFAEDWQLLQRHRAAWHACRTLAPPAPSSGPTLDAAAVWQMIGRLDSQPLRPVDDARFVLSRLPLSVLGPLLDACFDESAYVREHALQTIAWCGPAAGLWQARDESGRPVGAADPVLRLTPLLRDRRLAPRAAEALGALHRSDAWDLLANALAVATDPELVVGLADALLRCGPAQGEPVPPFPDPPIPLPPEAAFSLALLRGELDADPDALPKGEQERRRRWNEERLATAQRSQDGLAEAFRQARNGR